MSQLARGVLGVVALLLIAWLLSERRRLVSWRFVAAGILLQLLLAAALLKLPFTTAVFAQVNRGVIAVQEASQTGSSFVFGFLGGAPAPYEPSGTGSDVVLAFRILPLIIVVSALAALLTYWRILPAVVQTLARLFERIMGIGGAVALCSVANPFLGMVESSILIRPYIERLTRSELCIVMCTGLATIAGTVLVLYATMLGPVIHNSAGHLLIASIISLPAAVVVARVLIPEDAPSTPGHIEMPSNVHGTFDAITQGTRQGLALFLNIVAVLLVFVALIHLLDALLSQLPNLGGRPLTLERFIGLGFAPVAWLIGIPWNEAPTVGALLGTKTVLNELLAYVDLAGLSESALSERSRLIATYALCGFANFGSVGILVTGLSTMAPSRRAEIAQLGVRALVGGTLANCITAAVAGILL
jgi:concentrative nucleoside transporter, CNT family